MSSTSGLSFWIPKLLNDHSPVVQTFCILHRDSPKLTPRKILCVSIKKIRINTHYFVITTLGGRKWIFKPELVMTPSLRAGGGGGTPQDELQPK